jgi:hypothetical protein
MLAPSQILHNSTRGYGVEKYPVEQDPAFESQLEVTSSNPQTSHYVPPHLDHLTVQPHMMWNKLLYNCIIQLSLTHDPIQHVKSDRRGYDRV